MLHSYCPEMNEKEPVTITTKQVGHLSVIKSEPIEMRATIGHYGGYYIRTKTELKGQGIRKLEEGHYKLTNNAFVKLEKTHEIKMISYLD